MKKLQTLLAMAVGCALLNAVLCPVAQAGELFYATVINVKGNVSYSPDGGAHTYPLMMNQVLEAGATIYTSGHGMVDLFFGQAEPGLERVTLATDSPRHGFAGSPLSLGQNAVRVMPNSTLDIKYLSPDLEELRLKRGALYVNFWKPSAGIRCVVAVPASNVIVANFQPAQFSVDLNPDGTLNYAAVFKSSDEVDVSMPLPDGRGWNYWVPEGEMWGNGGSNPELVSARINRQMREVFGASRSPYHH